MKSLFYRRMMTLALAMGVAACGSKASFEIKGQILGLEYDGLALTDVASGSKITIAKGATTFQFPNSIDYGTAYDVQIAPTGPITNQPSHQTCDVINGKDTAGRLATINIGVRCVTNTYAARGTVTIANATAVPGGEVTGLTVTNGSKFDAIVAVKETAAYSFPGIPYGTSYGLNITKQPTVQAGKPTVTCKFVTAIVKQPGSAGMSTDELSFADLIADMDAVVNVVCNAAAQ